MAKYDTDTKAYAEAVGTALAVLHDKIEDASSVPGLEETKYALGCCLGTRRGYREKLRDFAVAAYLAIRNPSIEVH